MPGESVRLSDLIAVTEGTIIGATDPVITDVEHDSRRVGAGALYVAIRGHTSDGHSYLETVSRTAAAVCVEDAAAVDVPQLVVRDTRQALGRVAHVVHGQPSKRLSVAGITGTNGKTTVTYLLESIANAAGLSAGLIGTIGARIAGDPVPTSRTTPEASELHRLLAKMVADGVSIAAIEVSSHALDLFRVEAVDFSVVAFTNLSQDHLDFHGDMERYYRAKAQLFDPHRAHHAVINTDDRWGKRLADELRETPLPVTAVLGEDAALSVSGVEQGLEFSTFVMQTPQGVTTIRLPLGGRFNVDNAVVAAGCALGLGFDLAEIKRGLEATEAIPGRVEHVDAGQDFAVLVDYAHTPEAIAAIVEETAGLAGRVIVVLGAGGDRDREKRPLMGAAAARQSSLVIVTADNPRSEDPAAIAEAVAAGARDAGSAEVVEIADRSEAIGHAIRMAVAGDAVLILGKGHEQGQESSGRVVPFDDRAVARNHLAKL